MRTFTIQIAFIIIFSVFLPVAKGQSAKELNTQGLREYRNKNLDKAIELFKKALEKNPKYALAHYNLACTLTIMEKIQCSYQLDEILEHLEKAVKLDPRRRKRMKEDTDFKSIRNTFRFQTLGGLSPEKPNDLRKMLLSIRWTSPQGQMFDPSGGIVFYKNGIVKAKERYYDYDDDDNMVVHNWKSEGKYNIEQGVIKIMLEKPYGYKKMFKGKLKKNGVLEIPDLGKYKDHIAAATCDA